MMAMKRSTLFAVFILIQNIFGYEIVLPDNANTTLLNEPHDTVLNKTDLSRKSENVTNIQYVFPNNNLRKEISLSNNRSERYLYFGMEDPGDAVLIYPSIVNIIEENKNDNVEKSFPFSENENIHSTESEEEVKSVKVEFEQGVKSNFTNSEQKEEITGKNLSVEIETKHSNIRERLANLSKLQTKNHKNMKLKLAQSATELQPIISAYNLTVKSTVLIGNESVSQNISSHSLERFVHVLNNNVDVNITNDNEIMNLTHLTSEETVILAPNLVSNSSDINSESMNVIVDNETSRNESESLLSKSVSVNNNQNEKDTMFEMVLEDSFESDENNSRQHEVPDFHVEMIPFTMDDVMVASGSETKNYWTIPENEEIKKEMIPQSRSPSREMIGNMIKNQVMDARKRMKKYSSTQKEKRIYKSEKYVENSENLPTKAVSEEEKIVTKTLLKETPYINQIDRNNNTNIFDRETIINDAEISTVGRLIYPKMITSLQESSYSMYPFIADRSLDRLVVDGSLTGVQWQKSLQNYMPIEQSEPTRIRDLLIIGPIPKSLPQQFRYEPFHDQMQLPKV